MSGLTHADPLAGDACVLWCVGIDRAIREGRLDGVRDGLILLPEERREFWAGTIEEATTRPPSSFHSQRICRDGFPGGAVVGLADACS